MRDFIIVDLTYLSSLIGRLRARPEPIERVLTTEIITLYMGAFCSNSGTDVHRSWNAQWTDQLFVDTRGP